MGDECDTDNVTNLFDLANAVFEGECAGDVIYTIGMLIAHAIKTQQPSQDVDAMFAQLREVVAIELVAQI